MTSSVRGAMSISVDNDTSDFGWNSSVIIMTIAIPDVAAVMTCHLMCYLIYGMG